MGRRSFDVAEGHWGPNPPFRTPVFVLTHTAHELITRGETSFQFVTDGVQHAIERARQAAGGKDVGLHGGSVIQQAIRAKVLDEVQLHLVPVLLGSGRRLFDNCDDQPSRWDIVRVLDSAAVTHVKYRLVG